MKHDVLREMLRLSDIRNRDLEKILDKHNRTTLWRKLTGKSDWRLHEIIAVSQKLGLTGEQFLDLIEYDKEVNLL